MGIMAAGMHHTLLSGTVWNVVLFQDGKRIHVGAKADRPFPALIEQCHHPGFSDALLDFQAKLLKDPGNNLCSMEFLEA